MFHFKNFSNLKTLTWKHFGIFFSSIICFISIVVLPMSTQNFIMPSFSAQSCNQRHFLLHLPNMFMPWYLLNIVYSFKNGFKRHIKMTDTMLTTLWLKIIMLWNVLRKPCKYSYLKTKLQSMGQVLHWAVHTIRDLIYRKILI